MVAKARFRSLFRPTGSLLMLLVLLVNAGFLSYFIIVGTGRKSCAAQLENHRQLYGGHHEDRWLDDDEERPKPHSMHSPALPLSAFGFCDACGPEDLLCAQYGEHNLARSRAYEGANARFKRVIRMAQAGQPVKIAVLGGSVTRGHGIKPPELWFKLFVDWWTTTFPQSKTTWINGAIPATGSDYMSMCFLEHIEDDADLIFTEVAVNDQRIESNSEAFEWFMRALLVLPKNPAVINIQTFGLAYPLLSTGGDLHLPVAMYYDVPTINLRNVIMPQLLQRQELDIHYFAQLNRKGDIDWRHIGKHSHRVLADMTIAYTQRQICAVEREDHRRKTAVVPTLGPGEQEVFGSTVGGPLTLPSEDSLDTIPRLLMMEKYNRTKTHGPVVPFCMSTRTTKHPLTPIENTGWADWTFKGIKDKPYLRATQPGAKVSFKINVHSMGRVRVTYLKSNTFGLGSIFCWVDDSPRKIRVDGHWNVKGINIASVYVISNDTPPGEHTLTCELLEYTMDPGGGTEFRLIAVDAA